MLSVHAGVVHPTAYPVPEYSITPRAPHPHQSSLGPPSPLPVCGRAHPGRVTRMDSHPVGPPVSGSLPERRGLGVRPRGGVWGGPRSRWRPSDAPARGWVTSPVDVRWVLCDVRLRCPPGACAAAELQGQPMTACGSSRDCGAVSEAAAPGHGPRPGGVLMAPRPRVLAATCHRVLRAGRVSRVSGVRCLGPGRWAASIVSLETCLLVLEPFLVGLFVPRSTNYQGCVCIWDSVPTTYAALATLPPGLGPLWGPLCLWQLGERRGRGLCCGGARCPDGGAWCSWMSAGKGQAKPRCCYPRGTVTAPCARGPPGTVSAPFSPTGGSASESP